MGESGVWSVDDLLSIQHLSVTLNTPAGVVYGVRDASLSLAPGEIHGLVGESGCGKSLTVKSIVGLHDADRTHVGGKILFAPDHQPEVDLLALSQRELREYRGGKIGMIFQDPQQALNPLMTIGTQMVEMLRLHQGKTKKEAWAAAAELLERVGIFPGRERTHQYPFEFSGGMLQRVCIAMAISCQPRLLLADEPTTALDVTTQAQILELIRSLRDRMGLSVLLVTHNFGVVAELCDRVSVMYAGQVVETGTTRELLDRPKHPYTRDLIASIPGNGEAGRRLRTIPGSPPDLRQMLESCPYAPRCALAEENCRQRDRQPGQTGHWSACWKEEA